MNCKGRNYDYLIYWQPKNPQTQITIKYTKSFEKAFKRVKSQKELQNCI